MPQARYGIATLNRDEYERIRAAVNDPHNLPPAFETWLGLSEKIKQAHERMGASTCPVHVDLAALVAYRGGDRPTAADCHRCYRHRSRTPRRTVAFWTLLTVAARRSREVRYGIPE